VETDIFYCDENDAELYTRTYMQRYGIDKVRGGHYISCILTLQQLKEIHEHQYMDYIMCTKCAMYGHNNKKCPFKNVIPCLAIEDNTQYVKRNHRHCLSSIRLMIWGLLSNTFHYRMSRDIRTHFYD
jgi:hypothetical protein